MDVLVISDSLARTGPKGIEARVCVARPSDPLYGQRFDYIVKLGDVDENGDWWRKSVRCRLTPDGQVLGL